jgi:hypothetical protein
MRRYSTFILAASIFIALSAVIYLVHYFIFRDPYHIFIYMIGDLAFLPLEVFLVVIIIERILARRAKQEMLQKLNMVIGAFFSEVGNHLLRDLLSSLANCDELCQRLTITQNWTPSDFKKATIFARSMPVEVDYHHVDLTSLRTLLIEKRNFLLRLLENPNLLEHERFTDLLWAAFHLAEELEARPSMSDLPEPDLQHIAGDIHRLYSHLVAEWVVYVEHLKANYPFLFSLVLRTHPFLEHPSPVVN